MTTQQLKIQVHIELAVQLILDALDVCEDSELRNNARAGLDTLYEYASAYQGEVL